MPPRVRRARNRNTATKGSLVVAVEERRIVVIQLAPKSELFTCDSDI